MTVTTARRLITASLKLVQAIDPIDSVEPEDAADGHEALNDMVDAWALETLYVMSTVKVSATFAGQTATIGPSGTFNMTHQPVRINHAFVRRGAEDRGLQILNAQQYDALPLKSLTDDYPTAIYLQRTMPLATLSVWPVPAAATLYFLNIDTVLSAFATLDTEYEVGRGYVNALKFALCEQLEPIFGGTITPQLAKNIKRAKRLLKRSNLVVPTVEIETPFRNGRHADVVSGSFPYP